MLIILANADRPKTPEQIDGILSAELPPNPSEPGIYDKEKVRRQPLWDIVLTNMIHGPCGANNPQSPCMANGKCTKHFPKPFRTRTIVDSETSYPVYQRRSPEEGSGSAIKNGKFIDNSYVVPFSPYLISRYQCHINVEICISPVPSK